MGLLSLGTPLSFSETEQHVGHVHARGIAQLRAAFATNLDRDHDAFLWGDEVEYMLVHFDEHARRATLDCEHDYLLTNLDHDEAYQQRCRDRDVLFHPEYGRFMVEATPHRPYAAATPNDLLYVERNMAARRAVMAREIALVDGKRGLADGLANGESEHVQVAPLSIAAFPTMGVPGFTYKDYLPRGGASHSLFLPDEIINRHVRFPTLTKNIRTRRGQKVAINVPIFPDTHTQRLDRLDAHIPRRALFPEDSDPFLGAALPGHIYMDSMGFGMGCSCLQITMQAANIDQCRYLYDALLPLTPVLLALTAAAPIFKGTLADQDVRWNVISSAVDDRTPVERGVPPLKGHRDIGGVSEARRAGLRRIRKSRYESIDRYLGDYDRATGAFGSFTPAYNDLPSELNDKVYRDLLAAGFDDNLAKHFAYLFIRDPLVLFSERAKEQAAGPDDELDDELDDDHFQNIQSTNWQTLRFKPPSAFKGDPEKRAQTPGWRVEFRPMEIQITDFENAAFSVFIILVAKSILKYRPNFYLPVSLVDDNMATAHKRNSLLADKFWFRDRDTGLEETSSGAANGRANGSANGVANGRANGRANGTANGVSSAHGASNTHGVSNSSADPEWSQLSINEIVNGNGTFPGLVPLVQRYIRSEEQLSSDPTKLEQLETYLKLISYRASGKIATVATYIRGLVAANPHYKHDSVISHDVSYDLLQKLRDIGEYRDAEGVLDLFGDEIGGYLLKRGNLQ